VNSEGFRETFLRNGRKTQGGQDGWKERRQAEGGSVWPNREDQRKDQEFRRNEECFWRERAKNSPENAAAAAARTRERKARKEDQGEVEGKDIQESWETVKEIDKVLDHLEGRLDKMTAVIWQVAVQGRTPELATPGEGASQAGSRDSLEEPEVPALQSSLGEHRIVDVEPRAEGPRRETPWAEENSAPDSARSDSRGEEKKKEPSLEDQRRRAEEEYDKVGGLSRGCRQSWDLRLRGEKGPGRKINGLFHWASGDSLILHEVAKIAGLEGHGSRRKVGTLYMGSVESTCAYWIPIMDWKGEAVYLEARGVDYIAQLPGNEDPVRWYDRIPSLSAARDSEAEEKAPIEMMIARDNWRWMPVRQASRLTERQDKEEINDMRFLVRTQFGKRLLLLPCAEAFEIIPPERDEEEWFTEKGVSRGPTTTAKMLEQEEKEDARMERKAQDLCRQAEVQRRRAENRRESEAWRSRPRGQGSRKLAEARSIMVGVIAMLTASLASLAGVEGFKPYDCSNSSNPVDMYSLLDPEPCPDVAMDHVVERMLHGEIVQMKRERLIRITRCHVVESIMSQYCGWQSRAGVVRYLKFREPYTVEPSACRHANKTGMIVINKKSWPVQMGAVRSYSDYLEGSLDLGHNCQVGTHTHGGVVIDRQVTQSTYPGSIGEDGMGPGE
jgi:hypothetical protein